MTMSSAQSSEMNDRIGSGNVQSESYGSEYRSQLLILNSNFLSSIQKALKKSPDACLAPLVMDYLQFLYPLVKNPEDSAAIGKLKANDSIDFGTIAKFFQELKNTMTSSNGSNGENSLKTCSSDSATVIKASVPNKPFFSIPSSTVTAQRSSQTSSPSLFGQMKHSTTNNSGGNFNAPVSTSSSNVSKPNLELDSKSTNLFQSTGSSALTSITFGSSVNTVSNSSSLSSTTSVSSPFASSTLQNPMSSAPSSSSTTTMSSFSFGTLSSAPTSTLPSITFGSNGLQNPGAISFNKPLFGTSPSSGFGQSSFGTSISAAVSKPSGVNGASEASKEDSDDDSPPKPDHVPVLESDSLYSQRVKLFEMEGKAFKDLGIGNLFIKQTESGKHQLVVRADNSLGSILINVVLNSSMVIRQNKPTNVLATIPDSKGKPVTYLLRVKEESIGNELFKNLEKYKAK